MKELHEGNRLERMSALTEWVDMFWSKEGADFAWPTEVIGEQNIKELQAAERRGTFITEHLTEGELGFGPELAAKRAAYVGLRIDTFPIFVVGASETPAIMVMWVYALRHSQAATGTRVTTEGFKYFCGGKMPTREEFDELWDAQKVLVVSENGRQSVCNLLDIIDPSTDFILDANEV